MKTPTEQHEQPPEVEGWRRKWLLDLGFNPIHAEDLLEHPDVAHKAADLVNAGCSPRLAYRILRE